MQVGEQRRRTALGEPVRPMLEIGVEEGADSRPRGLERALPERLERVGEAPDLPPWMLEPRVREPRLRVLAPKQLDVVADLLHRRPPQRGQVVVDAAEGTGGSRGEKVRRVAAWRDQHDDRLQGEPAEPAAEPAQPRHVQRGVRGIAQRAQRPDRLPHRRDREARAREVLDGEDEPDHVGTMTSSVAPSGSAK